MALLNRPPWQLAILSGLLVGLAYPPLPLGFLAWLGFIPLIHILLNARPWEALKLGYLSGSIANLVVVYWIGLNSGTGWIIVLASMIGAVLYLSIYWALFAWVLALVNRQLKIGLVIWPLLWVLMEYFRSFGSMGFPWINLAVTQTDYLPLIQLAEYTGTGGVALWIIIVNVVLYLAIRDSRNRRSYLLFTGLLLATVFLTGLWRMHMVAQTQPERTIELALVQPNINPNEKWERSKREYVFSSMDSTLVEALALKPQLVIWPESAVPAYLRINTYRRKKIVSRLQVADIPLLTGTVDSERLEDGTRKHYNGSLLILPDDSLTLYHKIHLVPFAEYIPLSWKFPLLKDLNFGQGNFDHGQMYTVFEVDSVRFSNLICYESSFPQLVRKFVKKGARLITIETNDAWVGNSSGPYQHYALAVLRAVENRVPVARSANTGISGFILPTGKSLKKIELNKRGIIAAELPISTASSFYARYGELFSRLCILITALLIGYEWYRKKTLL